MRDTHIVRDTHIMRDTHITHHKRLLICSTKYPDFVRKLPATTYPCDLRISGACFLSRHTCYITLIGSLIQLLTNYPQQLISAICESLSLFLSPDTLAITVIDSLIQLLTNYP